MKSKLIVSVCSFYAPEVAKIINGDDYLDVQIKSYPAHCRKNSAIISNKFQDPNYSDSDICYIGGICNINKTTDTQNIRRKHLEQCFELFINRELVSHYLSKGYYLVTNGWLKTVNQNIKNWGFDNQTSKVFFGESMKAILLLDTNISDDYLPNLKKLSEYMGLPYEIITVGLSHCKMIIDSLVNDWRKEQEHETTIEKISEISKKNADYMLIYEKLDVLVNLLDEKEIIELGFELLNILYAPSNIIFSEYGNDINEQYEFNGFYNSETNQKNSFKIEVLHSKKILAICEVNGIQYPQYIEEYKKTGKHISQILGLAIANARKYKLTNDQNKQLEIYSSKLNKLNQSKDMFFSIIAHDLRNPFNALIGFSDILMNNIDATSLENIKHYSEIINSTAKETFNLLEDLLQWAKIQKGSMVFVPEMINLYKIVESELLRAKASAQKKHIVMNEIIDSETDIFADQNMITTILRNLISNAIKFTNANGHISISSKHNKNATIISISDNGVGIPKEMQNNIFDITVNTSTIGTDNETSSGLGLTLCKEFVEKHNGQIWFESEVDKGTTFFISIPNSEKNKKI